MGTTATALFSACISPFEALVYYVLNESQCHLQCGGVEACFACDCETQGQEALDGGETEVRLGDCCFARHHE